MAKFYFLLVGTLILHFSGNNIIYLLQKALINATTVCDSFKIEWFYTLSTN